MEQNKIEKPNLATAEQMSEATQRLNKSSGYFYGGNFGDSIERRFTGQQNMLGGGSDGMDGISTTNWNANGYGSFYSGLTGGVGRMNSGALDGFGGGGFTFLRNVSSNSAINHNIIASCMNAYFHYGIVKNVVDTYANFASENLEIEHPDKQTRAFLRAWANKVKLNDRVYNIFINAFIAGTIFVHRKWADLSVKEQRSMKRAKSSTVVNDNLILHDDSRDNMIIKPSQDPLINFFHSWGIKTQKKELPEIEDDVQVDRSYRIPWGYTILNPLQMEIRGSRFKDEHRWAFVLNKMDTEALLGTRIQNSSTKDLGESFLNVPQELKGRIKKYSGKSGSYFSEITLSEAELSVLYFPGKFDWFDWAIPFVYPVLKPLGFKDCLRSMEVRAAHSVINAIYLFKLGNIQKGLPAEPEHFERFADMLQQPAQAMLILWNEAIEGQVLQPDIDGIFGTDKHESADRDILIALGIPEVLIGGKGGNFTNSFIAVSSLLERLESVRNMVIDWIMTELLSVSKVMGFKKLPTVKFGQTSLKDEKGYQAFLTSLYDRNILSADTILKEANTDVATESRKLKDEKLISEKGVLEQRGPFVRDENKAVKTPKTPNGRPTNSVTGPTGKQANPRGPKASVAETLRLQEQFSLYGKNALDYIEQFCADNLIKSKAAKDPRIKYIKQLQSEERERLEQLVYNIFSYIPPKHESEAIQDEYIVNLLESDACINIKQEVLNIYNQKIQDFYQAYGKGPSRESRRNFIVSAWTQVAIHEHLQKKQI